MRLARRSATTSQEARAALTARAGAAEADIFAAHALLLDDTAIIDPALRRIDEGEPAGRAWRAASREAASAFRALDDSYLRERAVDVEDVSSRVLARLAGVSPGAVLEAPGIVVADELTPRESGRSRPGRRLGDRHRARRSHRARGHPRARARHPRGGRARRRAARDRRGHAAGRRRRGGRDPRRSRPRGDRRARAPARGGRGRPPGRAGARRRARRAARRPPGRGLRERRQPRRGAPGFGPGRRGHRPAAHRVPVPRPCGTAQRGGAGRGPARDRRRAGRPSGRGAHARHRSRQAAAVHAPGRRRRTPSWGAAASGCRSPVPTSCGRSSARSFASRQSTR